MSAKKATKFKNVYADPSKPDLSFLDVRNIYTSGEGTYVGASATFAGVTLSGGGGPVLILKLDSPGRVKMGAPLVNVNKGKVLDLKFNPFMDNMIATAGEDARVCLSIIPPDGPTENITTAAQILEGHAKKVSLIEWNPVSNNIISSASYDRTVKTWDCGSGQPIFSYDELGDNAYSLGWNYTGTQLAVTGKDKKLRILDPRQPDAAQVTESFDGLKSSKLFWCDNHGWIGAVGFTKTAKRRMRIWDLKDTSKPLFQRDIDQASSTFMPYYDYDTNMLFLAGKGDGSLQWMELANEGGVKLYKSALGYRNPEPQKGGCFLPKRGVNPMKCEVAKFLKLTRNSVQPISFICPRKAEAFQADIYPDTRAGVPAQQCDEWAKGNDVDPTMQSMDPSQGGGASQAGAVFTKKATYAELEARNQELEARVKELEEELAALKS